VRARARTAILILLAMGMAVVVALPATAQTTAAAAGPASEIAAGYSFLHELGTGGAPANVYNTGWTAAYSRRLGPGAHSLAAVGEVTSNYRDSFGELWTLYGFLGGIRMPVCKVAGLSVFAQALVGLELYKVPGFSERGLAFQPGGGVDVPLGRSLKLRVQGDYRLAHVAAEDTTFKEARFATSIVFGFR